MRSVGGGLPRCTYLLGVRRPCSARGSAQRAASPASRTAAAGSQRPIPSCRDLARQAGLPPVEAARARNHLHDATGGARHHRRRRWIMGGATLAAQAQRPLLNPRRRSLSSSKGQHLRLSTALAHPCLSAAGPIDLTAGSRTGGSHPARIVRQGRTVGHGQSGFLLFAAHARQT